LIDTKEAWKTPVRLSFREIKFESLSAEQLALLDKMLSHYEKAYSQEFSYAARSLGRLYLAGLLFERDYRKAYQYFEKAIEWGLPDEHATLAEMHELGQGVPVTYTEAAYHYRLAALEGRQSSLRCLINLYLSGKLGEIDLDRARFWLNRMMASGDFTCITTAIDISMQKKSIPPQSSG
jgi:TPR repeat protein